LNFFSLCINQVGAPARVGLVAPIDVIVPPGNTGLDPSQTSFFQVDNSKLTYYTLFINENSILNCSVVSGAQHSDQD